MTDDDKNNKSVPAALPAQIFFRSKTNVELCAMEGDDKKCRVLASGYSTFHVFHPDGSDVLVQFPSKGILKCDLSLSLSLGENENNKVTTEAFLSNSSRIGYCMYSPKGTYILTWERANSSNTTKDKDGNVMDANGELFQNLKIWNGSTGQYLHGFPLKNLRREQWPPIQWTHDEAYAFHLVTNHVHVYKGQNVFMFKESIRYERKISCEGINSFSVPKKVVAAKVPLDTNANANANANAGDQPIATYLFTTFVPETKGKPAKLALLRYPDALGSSSGSKPPLASKSFYQAEECKAMWSPRGDAALVLTSTSVDSSGASYYGSSNLYLITAQGDAGPVPMPGNNTDETIHDVAWMPDGNKAPSFAMLSGRMPALGSLHHGGSGQPLFLFGNAHRNTIIWSPHGRFLNLAGFGNLAGGMDFWDRNKFKKIPIFYDPADKPTFGNTAQCAVGYGWSPNSRYFMVSTTSPRMNVDNNVKVFKYNGMQLANLPWENDKYAPDKLLAAEFVPTPHSLFPDRPQTPPPRRPKGQDTTKTTTNEEHNHTPNNNTNNNNIATNGVGGANTNNNNDAKPPSFVKPPGRYVPPAARRAGTGGTTLAERMRKEREGSTMGPTRVNNNNRQAMLSTHNKKRLPVGMSVEAAAAAENNMARSKNALRRERQRLAKQKAEADADAKKKEESRPEPEKVLKKLRKALKQIEALKEKDFETLNDDQKEKLASEDMLFKELKALKL